MKYRRLFTGVPFATGYHFRYTQGTCIGLYKFRPISKNILYSHVRDRKVKQRVSSKYPTINLTDAARLWLNQGKVSDNQSKNTKRVGDYDK